MDTLAKLQILAEAAKYDVACTSSGVTRGPERGRLGMASPAGCCHSFTPDGRCITLLKVLMSNACSYDCAYCVNRRSASCPRATFSPRELAELTVDFYRRNYIEGLFLSSGVLGTPDATSERMVACLRILRDELGFRGYVHAKVIPGTSPELLYELGLLADRLSVNLELPSAASLASLCPEKGRRDVLSPMAQIARTRSEEEARLLAAGGGRGRTLRQGMAATTAQGVGTPSGTVAATPRIPASSPESPGSASDASGRAAKPQAGHGTHGANVTPELSARAGDARAMAPASPATGDGASPCPGAVAPFPVREKTCGASGPLPLRTNGAEMTMRTRSRVASGRRAFAPAGQSTQLIVGASPEDDNHILQLSAALYRRFDLKRVFFSAYIPMLDDRRLPEVGTPVPLRREHRLYQADWLMRYYGFAPDELATPEEPWLDLDLDPKLAWALRNVSLFPVEVMEAPLSVLLRVPGVGPVGARRIVAARRTRTLGFDDLRAMHVTLKRARPFLTCAGQRDPEAPLDEGLIRQQVAADARRSSYNRTRRALEGTQLTLF